MTATIKIHGVPFSTFTRTVRMAASEKGIDYELVPAMPSQLGALNPFSKIPVMVHGDFALYESPAIVRYLDRSFAGPRLWPDDPQGAALCDQWISAVCDSLVNSALRYIASRLGFLPVPAEMQASYLDKTREVVPAFDARLGASAYLAGRDLTAADLFLFPIVCNFPAFPETAAVLAAAPNCQRWMADLAARPSAGATLPGEMPRLAA